MDTAKRYKAVFFDLGGTLRIALLEEPYMRHARRKIAEIAGSPMPYEEFYHMLEERYELYLKWAFGTNKESGDEELWCKWLLPDYDWTRIKQVCHELSFLYRQVQGPPDCDPLLRLRSAEALLRDLRRGLPGHRSGAGGLRVCGGQCKAGHHRRQGKCVVSACSSFTTIS